MTTVEDCQPILSQALDSVGAIPRPPAPGCCASADLHGLEINFRWQPRSGGDDAPELHAMIYLRSDSLEAPMSEMRRLLVANAEIGAASPYFFCLEPDTLRPALACFLGPVGQGDAPNLARALDGTTQAVLRWYQETE